MERSFFSFDTSYIPSNYDTSNVQGIVHWKNEFGDQWDIDTTQGVYSASTLEAALSLAVEWGAIRDMNVIPFATIHIEQ